MPSGIRLEDCETVREYLGSPFIIDKTNEWFVQSICNGDEYSINCFTDVKPRTILDIGGHVGVFTKLCLVRFPEARLVVVEPHPRNFELLKWNLEVAGLLTDRVKLINAAIAPSSGWASYRSERVQLVGGDPVPSPSENTNAIRTIPVAELLKETEEHFKEASGYIDLCKLDAEGAEYWFLPEMRRMQQIHKICWLRGEYHGEARVYELKASLRDTHEFRFSSGEIGSFIAHRKLGTPPYLDPTNKAKEDYPVSIVNHSTSNKNNKKLAIVTMSCGDYRKFTPYAFKLMNIYANRIGASFVEVVPKDVDSLCYDEIQLCKLSGMEEALDVYDRVLWLDCDTIIRPDAPNIFEIVPDGYFGAVNEIPLCVENGGAWLEEINVKFELMTRTCFEEGKPIPNFRKLNRYFNCGVQVASRIHKPLYRKALNAVFHPLNEQNRINLRLMDEGWKVYELSADWNTMMWSSRKHSRRNAYVIHYCGEPSLERRIALCDEDFKFWCETYKVQE